MPSDTNKLRDGLVTSNLAFVQAIARSVGRRLPPSFDREDLDSTGYMALIGAAASFDPVAHAGVPFTAYARKIVRGAILESVRRRNWTANTCAPLEDAPEAACTAVVYTSIDNRRQLARIAEASEWLPFPQRFIMREHYGPEESPLAAIAKQMGMSVAWVYVQHDQALAVIRKRCAGEMPVARRLAVMASKPKNVVPLKRTPAAGAAAALAAELARTAAMERAEVDELGALEKEFAPLRPKLARIEQLRKSVRARYEASPAAATFEAQGDRFVVMVGARANESVINYPKLIKTIGAKLFATIAKTTLKALEESVPCSVRAEVITVEPIGPRSLKTFERGTPAAPERPKAA